MSPTRPVLWSLLASLALGCNAGRDTGDDSGDDTADDTADTDTADTDTSDTDTGTTFTCPADDTFEQNDDSATATALTAGTDIDAQLCEGDSDFFAIAVPQDCIVEATLDFDPAAVDFDFYLYDALELIGYSESGDTDETILHKNAGAATTWFLEAYPYDGEGAYSINFHCATSTCTDDDNEPNDDFDHAASLAAGTAEVAQACLVDNDWYAIPVGAGCDVDVHLDFLQTDGDLDLGLTDAASYAEGDFLDTSGSEDDDEDVSFTNNGPATTYYALVIPYADAEAAYTITATLSNCAPACTDTDDDAAQNDDALTAVALDEDPALDGQVCAYDEDWYTLTSKFGCDVEVDLTYTNADGDLDLFLYDEDENFEDASTDTTGTEAVTFNNRLGSADATLYAVVSGDQADQGSYSIAMIEDCNPCEDDGGEEGAGNDTQETAIPLAEATALEAAICAGDEDWIELDVEPGCKLTATLDIADLDEGDLDLFLLDADGVAITSSTSLDDESIVYRVHATDDATPLALQVVGDEGDEGAYTLTYTVNCDPCTDAGEVNDTSDDAYGITAGNTFDGRSCGGVDDDWFTFTPTTGCEGTVTLVASGDGAEVDLTLYDGEDIIDSSDESSATQMVYYDNGDTDFPTLNVLASHYSGDEPNYTLVWQEDCAACTDTGGDDTILLATALTAGAPLQGSICPDDVDTYKLTVGDGCVAYVELESEYFRGDLDIFLFDSTVTDPVDLFDDAIDASFYGNDHEAIAYVNDTASTTMYLQVVGYTAAGPIVDNDYTLSYLSICECPEDEAGGLNVDMEHAEALTPNEGTYEGGMCATDDSDWYSFTAGANCTVEAMLYAMGYNDSSGVYRGDLDLFLHSADEELDSSEIFSNVDDIVYEVGPAEQELFLQVLGYDIFDDLGMPYELTVETTCPE